jgi:hypothetical protein
MAASDRTKALCLVVFAPVFAEMLSGSTSPVAFLFPWVLGIFMMIYGVSALLIREASVRWKTGPVGVVLLGLAFGILNEGMAAHSLFNPNWPDLGALADYGRWMGVNWLWAEWIVPFHAIWSIGFPILLVRQFWPDLRDRPIVSRPTLYALLPVPFLGAAITTALFIRAPPTLVEWVGMFLALGLLVGITYRFAPQWRRWKPLGTYVPTPRLAVTIGFLLFVGGQIGTFATPRLGPYPEVGFALVGALLVAAGLWATSFGPDPAGERARFAYVIGGFAFYAALSPISEFAEGRWGLVPIDALALATFVWLYRRRSSAAAGAGTPPAGAVGAVEPAT